MEGGSAGSNVTAVLCAYPVGDPWAGVFEAARYAPWLMTWSFSVATITWHTLMFNAFSVVLHVSTLAMHAMQQHAGATVTDPYCAGYLWYPFPLGITFVAWMIGTLPLQFWAWRRAWRAAGGYEGPPPPYERCGPSLWATAALVALLAVSVAAPLYLGLSGPASVVGSAAAGAVVTGAFVLFWLCMGWTLTRELRGTWLIGWVAPGSARGRKTAAPPPPAVARALS